VSLLFILFTHLLVTLARLARPGGVCAVAAESLAVKHQLLIMKRSRRRSPNLTRWDRAILGFCTLLAQYNRADQIPPWAREFPKPCPPFRAYNVTGTASTGLFRSSPARS